MAGLFTLLSVAISVAAAGEGEGEAETDAASLRAGARVETNLRLRPDGAWLDFRDAAVFSLWASSAPSERVKARGAVDLRLHTLATLDSLEGLSEPQLGQPWSLRVRDAWLRLGAPGRSVQVGVQRIAWGVGYGISLVDHLNPWDLEDPTRFDRRLSTVAAHGIWAPGAFSAEAAWSPFFVPGALPADGASLTAGASDVFDAAAFGAEGVEVNALETRLALPAAGIADGGLAARLRWSGARADVAASWYHGRDSLPQVSGEVLLTGFQTDTGRVDVGVPMVYPRLDVAGLTVKGELPAGLSAWGEAAWVWPAATLAAPSEAQLAALLRLGTLSEIPDPIPQTVTQDGAPYLRGLLGVDRFFGPVYLNVQWLHGFPTERQQADLRDYGLLAARWTVRPALRIEASAASDGRGWLAGGQVAWLYDDAAELSLGYSHVGGPEDSALGGLLAVRHARLRAQVVF